jgi:hypothetical protein
VPFGRGGLPVMTPWASETQRRRPRPGSPTPDLLQAQR